MIKKTKIKKKNVINILINILFAVLEEFYNGRHNQYHIEWEHEEVQEVGQLRIKRILNQWI